MKILTNLSFKYALLSFFIVTSFISTSAYSKEMDIVSPNEKIRVVIRVSDKEKESIKEVLFKVELRSENKYVEMIDWSPLGIRTSIGNFVKNMKYVSSSKSINLKEEYKMPFGKKSIYRNEATARTIQFLNDSGNGLTINFRAYNDGVAFRYEIEETSGKNKPIHILDEASQYSIVTPTNAWLQNYKIDYEEFYDNKLLDDAILEARFAYPALFEINSNAYMLITEANLGRESVASSLTFQRGSNKYKVTYPEARENFPNVGIVADSSWDSPWRVMIVGSLADIVQSTLVTDLSEPSKIKNDDWVVAGAASWVYWANNHGSKDYKTLKSYVDLAYEMKWPYTLIDWEWDAMENGGSIEDIVRYSVSKGVKPWMWYNSGTSWLTPTPVDHMVDPEKRKKVFTWLNKMGVVGVKVDFFAGDQQDMVNYYIDLLEDAAEHKIMVNFHGATLPRGWQRTYPNLMTTEAVYGAEWYNNVPTFTDKAAPHNATLPFTRNVVGSMDYTPVTFTHSQNPHITTHSHELALSILFESAIQNFADRPLAYTTLPPKIKEFLRHVPVSWDESKLLDGYPGEFVVMARRKGDVWYIAGINGSNTIKSMNVDLSFVGDGKRQLILIKDGKSEKEFSILEQEHELKNTIQLSVPPRGGFSVVVK